MKLVKVFWNRIGIHLDVRVLGAMPLEMDFEISLGGEAVSADITFEGPLSCMGANVNLESRV